MRRIQHVAAQELMELFRRLSNSPMAKSENMVADLDTEGENPVMSANIHRTLNMQTVESILPNFVFENGLKRVVSIK